MRCFTRLKYVFLVSLVAVVLCVSPAFAVVNLDRTEPENPPYLGGYWLSGTANSLGTVYVYLPTADGWCLNADGELFRYVSGSATGRMFTENGTEYNFSCNGFSLPRYRNLDNSYNYIDLHLTPVGGNIVIQDSFETPYSLETMSYVLIVFLCGMLVVVNLVKGR